MTKPTAALPQVCIIPRVHKRCTLDDTRFCLGWWMWYSGQGQAWELFIIHIIIIWYYIHKIYQYSLVLRVYSGYKTANDGCTLAISTLAIMQMVSWQHDPWMIWSPWCIWCGTWAMRDWACMHHTINMYSSLGCLYIIILLLLLFILLLYIWVHTCSVQNKH